MEVIKGFISGVSGKISQTIECLLLILGDMFFTYFYIVTSFIRYIYAQDKDPPFFNLNMTSQKSSHLPYSSASAPNKKNQEEVSLAFFMQHL